MSGSVSGSISDWFPAINQTAISASPRAPAPRPRRPTWCWTRCRRTRQCPYAATNVCPHRAAVEQDHLDTSGAGVAVDTYTLLRERRIRAPTNVPTGSEQRAAGLRDLSGFSGGKQHVQLHRHQRGLRESGREVYEYRYSVAAKICNNSSPQFSNTVVYPACNIVVAVAAVGPPRATAACHAIRPRYGDSITVTRSSATSWRG